jgi:hypothetical protein
MPPEMRFARKTVALFIGSLVFVLTVFLRLNRKQRGLLKQSTFVGQSLLEVQSVAPNATQSSK